LFPREHASQLQRTEHPMKTATIPSLCVDPELRAAAESVLKEGETLSAFVETRRGRRFTIARHRRSLLRGSERRLQFARRLQLSPIFPSRRAIRTLKILFSASSFSRSDYRLCRALRDRG
jgi:hypothetical protein